MCNSRSLKKALTLKSSPPGNDFLNQCDIGIEEKTYPLELYFCKEFVDSQKLKGFIVGPDNRARCSLNMFGIITGRTNQSTARYPFNTAKPMRNIMKPNAGWAFLYSDYKSQEIAIAAYLSKDPMFMTAYESGDIYCYAAALANRCLLYTSPSPRDS